MLEVATPEPTPPQPAPAEAPPPAAAPPGRPRVGASGWIAIAVASLAVLAAVFVALKQFGVFHPAPTRPPAAPATAAAGASAPANTMVAWDASKDRNPATYSIDGLSLTVSAASTPDGHSTTVLQVVSPDGRVATLQGDPSFAGASVHFGVGRLDASGEGVQVLVTDFTGGAHCCDHIRALELAPGGWRIIDVGSFEGDASDDFPKDVDGDGVPDIIVSDDRFAYAFTDFADSYAPPQIFNIVRGAAVDVSASPRYASLFRADMKRTQAVCEQHGNGGCAAFVADASRLGLHDWAWRLMLASYDSQATWTWPTQCLVSAAPGQCPPGQQQTFGDMPDALQAFLVQTGYVTTPAAAPADAGAPSFDCAGVSQPVILLICNTPSLAQADRDLAAAYDLAMTQSPDPTRLRDDQRRWIVRRSQMPADANALSAMYAERIRELQAGQSPP